MKVEWHDNTVFPNIGSHVLIRFVNDLGWFYAAGIVHETSDTQEIVFIEVLSGNCYDWKDTVKSWAYLSKAGA